MMKSPVKERLFLSGAVFALAVVLITLAVMQYHWSLAVSSAATERLKAGLESSINKWCEDVNREFAGVFVALQVDPGLASNEKLNQYVERYQSWSRTAPHPDLVADVFVLTGAGTKDERLMKLNVSTNQFQPAEWPSGSDQMQHVVDSVSSRIVLGAKHLRSAEEFHRQHEDSPFPLDALMAGPVREHANTILFDGMFLARMQFNSELLGHRSMPADNAILDWVIVRPNHQVLQQHILPELAERYFSGPHGLDYQVAVVSGPDSQEVIYSSDSEFGKQADVALDAKVPVFAFPRMGPLMGPPPRRAMPQAREHHEPGFMGLPRIQPLGNAERGQKWELLVRHRQGSLEAAVAGMRRRNLEISFAVLLVLAASMGMVILATQRARVLARLQMDFVAAVSHELRTPLAVISSAADNIADGVVTGREQLSHYGVVIKDHAKQLIQLVEQILLFASTRGDRHYFALQPLQVPELVDSVLNDTAGLIRSAGFTVEKEIEPDLPPVMGDLSALSHCLQNLITNAIKYGGDARWMRIRARKAENEIQITVEDRGIGIQPSELDHIFEPFYRSPAVAAGQIHGTGLGLPLANNIARAMGGRFTVASEPGKGSSFTLHLPVARGVKAAASVPAAVVDPKLS
jgi:signal transduction histidine kinase